MPKLTVTTVDKHGHKHVKASKEQKRSDTAFNGADQLPRDGSILGR